MTEDAGKSTISFNHHCTVIGCEKPLSIYEIVCPLHQRNISRQSGYNSRTEIWWYPVNNSVIHMHDGVEYLCGWGGRCGGCKDV